MSTLFAQFTRFGLVGVLAAIGHYGTLIGLVELAGAGPVPGALAGYLVGGAISYVANRRWTFDSDATHREAVAKFTLVGSVFVAEMVTMKLNVVVPLFPSAATGATPVRPCGPLSTPAIFELPPSPLSS